MELGQEVQHVSRTEGGALETVRAAERQPSLEQCRRLAAMYDPLAVGRSLGDSRQSLSPTKVSLFKHGETLNKDIKSAPETSCPRI